MAINGWQQSLIEWAIGIGAAFGALLVTILGLRKRGHSSDSDGRPRPATQIDLMKMERQLLEADRQRAHEIYNRMQSMTTDYAMEDEKLMQRMEELFKGLYTRMDRHSEKLVAVVTDVAVLKADIAALKERLGRRS